MLLDTHQISFEFTVAQKCAKIGKVTVVCQCHQKLFSKLKRAWKLVVNLKRRAKVFGLGTTESKSNLTFRRSSKEATKGSQFSLLDFFSGFKERLSQGTIFPLSRRSLLQKIVSIAIIHLWTSFTFCRIAQYFNQKLYCNQSQHEAQ